jgi:hypothetical protein
MVTRPLPAGPTTELRGSQSPGFHEVRYVVAASEVDPFALAEDAFTPLLVTASLGHGSAEVPSGPAAPELDGLVVSSLRRRAAGAPLELRVFNPGDTVATLRWPGRRGAEVDLRGRPVAPFDGVVEVGPRRIVTLQVT